MEIIDSKKVKNYILDPTNDMDELVNYFDNNSSYTSEGIFNALFILLRHYEQNKSRIDYLLYLLEGLVSVKDVIELKAMLGPIKDFNNKINTNFDLKKRIVIREVTNRVSNVMNEINNNIKLSDSNSKSKCMEYLVFQDKNISMIESFINTYDNIMSTKDIGCANVFEKILDKYIFLEDSEEIEYFYHVIYLFINSAYGKNILEEKDKYISLIKKSKLGYKEHIIKLIELFDPDFKISLDEIEKRYGVSFDFPSVIYDEMNRFSMDNKGRVDYTNQECVTIDGRDDRCLDDALYMEKNSDGTYTLYIHITDIPAFVPAYSLINEEARKRIESLYLRDRNILLYPEYISNVYCSLLPNNKRNVITYKFLLDNNFSVIEDSLEIEKGKICSKHKLSYEDVDEIVNNPSDSNRDQMILLLYCFADRRRGQNIKKEKYRKYENFLRMETHHESLKIDYSPSANIVHEAMVLTNYAVGRYFKILSLPYVYRTVSIPSDDFIEKQLSRINKLDTDIAQSKSFVGLLRDSYMETIYTPKPVFHKGLNVSCYSHSTSPARRYVDAFGEYVIHDFLFNNNLDDINIRAWEYRVNELVKYINNKKQDNNIFCSQYNYLSYKKLIKTK